MWVIQSSLITRRWIRKLHSLQIYRLHWKIRSSTRLSGKASIIFSPKIRKIHELELLLFLPLPSQSSELETWIWEPIWSIVKKIKPFLFCFAFGMIQSQVPSRTLNFNNRAKDLSLLMLSLAFNLLRCLVGKVTY